MPDDSAKTVGNTLPATFRARTVNQRTGAISFIFVLGALYQLLGKVSFEDCGFVLIG